jgi:16S rRNA (uracil1498-N3)-methyltransferase
LRSARPPRLHVPGPWAVGQVLDLDAAVARHVQVLRLQPGDPVGVFDGMGREAVARVETIERRSAAVRIESEVPALPEPLVDAWLAVVMPANDRMDALVEKATELGAAGMQPLMARRSVLRLEGARIEQRRAHWQAVAVAACEQCGRARVPPVLEPLALADWLQRPQAWPTHRLLLAPGARVTLTAALAPLHAEVSRGERASLVVLSGPEGGLAPDEAAHAEAAGFQSVSLGPRVLRADTAPLAALAHLALSMEGVVAASL